jgi:hypothetical protein
MGYNIELAFNILKNSSVTELQDNIKTLASNYGCKYCYNDYEYENNVKYIRRHCIITLNFEDSNTNFLVEFLKKIKKMEGLYIELIYDEELNTILYASKYYQTQKMTKGYAKEYNLKKRKRSYSEDESMILNAISK